MLIKMLGPRVLFFSVLLGVYVPVSNVSAQKDFLEGLMERCSNGDQEACTELDELTAEYQEQVDALNVQADDFQRQVKSLDLLDGGAANIRKAHPVILDRYIDSGAVAPAHEEMRLVTEEGQRGRVLTVQHDCLLSRLDPFATSVFKRGKLPSTNC